MKTSAECLVCFVKQGLRVARMYGCDENTQQLIVREVAGLIPLLDPQKSPPANAMPVYGKINEVLACEDPYRDIKQMENKNALLRIEQIRREVRAADNPLFRAAGYAIAGNIIDYGASARFSIDDAMERGREFSLGVDHRTMLKQKVDSLSAGDHVLYLTDNCGEVVYDSLLLELLAETGAKVTVAVRGGAIINDALEEDARMAGLHNYGEIISSGAVCPGTPLELCSPEFLECFYGADLVVSKGQGNFETLSEVDRDVLFLLTVKCNVVGKHLAEIAGVDERVLPGKGELVVYYSDN